MKYRSEIDGLRAVAVIPVILFHAGFEVFSGGFVGVDIFFVISGFLITSIIVQEIEAGNFTFSRFYERRARRILPALFIVLLCCIPFAWMWMLPKEFKAFSTSLISVIFFASNIVFWRQGGYFDTSAELKPLLHTWSLAVEEQFYILFPVILLILWRFGRKPVIVTVTVIGIASLLLSEYTSHLYPGFNFYWALTRAWELMAGSLCALIAVRRCTLRDNALSAIGLAAIVGSLFLFDSSTRFPSLYAVMPVVGTCLVLLFAFSGTVVERLLSFKLFVGIGLISYSAYLWHQPLFAFARLRSLSGPSMTLMAVLTFVTFALAFLSWKFIETPVRERRFLHGRWVLPAIGAASALLIIAVGTSGHLTSGLPSRYDVFKHLSKSIEPIEFKCSGRDADKFVADPACIFGNKNNVRAAIVGDSHGASLSEALGNALINYGTGVWDLTHLGCPPLRGVTTMTRNVQINDCGLWNEDVFGYLDAHPDIDLIFLVARWPLYVEGVGFNNGEGGHDGETAMTSISVDGTKVNFSRISEIDRIGTKYQKTASELLEKGKRLVIVYSIPEIGFVPSDRRNRGALFGQQSAALTTTGYTQYRNRVARAHSYLDVFLANANVMAALPASIFCDTLVKDRCVTEVNGSDLYSDDNHLSAFGAEKITNSIVSGLLDKGWIETIVPEKKDQRPQ